MTDKEKITEILKAYTKKNNIMASVVILEQYADELVKNGVIVPPCKVGDTAYDICTIFDESTLKPKTIIKPRIIDFVSSVAFLIESKGLVIGEKEFGKTVFLTKEEAERALKEREQNG